MESTNQSLNFNAMSDPTIKDREFKGVWIPKNIWLNTELSMLDKIILIEIDSLDGPRGCFASNKYLAEFCQCSEVKVSNSISFLKDKGYIELESFNGRTRILRSCLNPDKSKQETKPKK